MNRCIMLEGQSPHRKNSAGNPFSAQTDVLRNVEELKTVNNTFDVDVSQQVVPADGLLRGR
jgi:conjugal transfer mating pair stabilization protein TraN